MSYEYRPNRFNLLPEVVKHILILNVLFFVVTLVAGNYGVDLGKTLGLHYPGKDEFRPYQFLTYMFMHGSFMHIFFNLFAFWMFGSAIEQVMGSSRFLLYYFITGIGAALLHNLVNYFEFQPVLNLIDQYLASPTEANLQSIIHSKGFNLNLLSYDSQETVLSYIDQYSRSVAIAPDEVKMRGMMIMSDYRSILLEQIPPVVGASGSVFGVLLAFGMLFPNTIIYLYFAIPIKAKYFVMIYGAIELMLGIKNSPVDNVAHFAHLGGMVFGFILIKIWKLDKY